MRAWERMRNFIILKKYVGLRVKKILGNIISLFLIYVCDQCSSLFTFNSYIQLAIIYAINYQCRLKGI